MRVTGAYLLTFIEQRYQGSEGKKAGESRSDPACIRSATNRAMYCINQVPTCVNNNQEGGDVPNSSGIPLPTLDIHHLTLALSTGRVDLQRVRHVEW